jgi:hypothetical protein
VPQQDLDEAQVRAVFHEVGREAVAEDVGSDPLADPGGLARKGDGALDGAFVKGTARVTAGEEPVLGPVRAPVMPQRLQEEGREHDLALDVALGVSDDENAAGTVDVHKAQMQGLGDAEPRPVQRHRDRTLLEARELHQEARDVGPAEHDGPALGPARIGQVRDHVLAPERDPVEEPERGRHLLVGRQGGPGLEPVVAQEVADFVGRQVTRAAADVGSHLGHAGDVHRLGAPGIVAQLKFGQHLATKGGHRVLPVGVIAGEPAIYSARSGTRTNPERRTSYRAAV